MTDTPWSDRFDELREELARIERQAATDDVQVKTYPDRTVVTLQYKHTGVEEGDGS